MIRGSTLSYHADPVEAGSSNGHHRMMELTGISSTLLATLITKY